MLYVFLLQRHMIYYTQVPIWILVIGGAGIVAGLATYGCVAGAALWWGVEEQDCYMPRLAVHLWISVTAHHQVAWSR